MKRAARVSLHTPCLPIALRDLPTHPMHKPWRKSWVLCSGVHVKSAACLHAALLDLLLPATLTPPAAQGATLLPISSSHSLGQG